MKEQQKLIWSEVRDDDTDGTRELFYVLAEQRDDEWAFFERSSWELRWYPLSPTKVLTERAIDENRKAHHTTSKSLHMKQVA